MSTPRWGVESANSWMIDQALAPQSGLVGIFSGRVASATPLADLSSPDLSLADLSLHEAES